MQYKAQLNQRKTNKKIKLRYLRILVFSFFKEYVSITKGTKNLLFVLKYSMIGYEYRLSPEKIYQLHIQLGTCYFDEISDKNMKNKIISIIDSLLVDYQNTIAVLLASKETKKENIKLVKYILSGYFNGLSCNVYKNCYNEE